MSSPWRAMELRARMGQPVEMFATALVESI
jgi:hypothetical protein